MFLKNLKIEISGSPIRNFSFFSGINLIVDETTTRDRKESGNNVGKTTVLRLIDYCLGGDGKNIYKDMEFNSKSNTQVERFLKDDNVIISLTLKENLEDVSSREIVIRRNFLTYSKKIQEINGKEYNNKNFPVKLKELIFHSSQEKPTFRQIISKNIRDEKSKLLNTIKVLHPTTTQEEYESLYLFWLGINIPSSERKQKLIAQKKAEENLQKRLRKENNLSQINQSLIIIDRNIEELTAKKNNFNLNKNYEEDFHTLNNIKSEINRLSTELSRLEFRKELIVESKNELETEFSQIDSLEIKNLYEEAKVLIPNLQKTFEDTLNFHNQMINEKIQYITKELPVIETKINSTKRRLNEQLSQENIFTEKLSKTGVLDELQKILTELNIVHEKKGRLEEQQRLWNNSIMQLKTIKDELKIINEKIESQENMIQKRITDFNTYFSNISNRLYGEQFILSSDKNDRGYKLNISSLDGNLGTGKKKGQIAAFDLAYIQFSDALNIDCLHFILHDQIENIHDNQITSLLTEIVNEVNCQYILPVLKDKLPQDINIDQYVILTLSQSDKLFKME
ncbi:MAG: DUF2326 domain-containing protein [Candidatus Magnetomorum sp.]|nr:DUF2326 domain-containing protein [Candidatus Magnetomorum sp.]